MSKCPTCKGSGEVTKARPLPEAHHLYTVIGPVLIFGELSSIEGEATKRKIEALSGDDDLWMKLYNAGINAVQVYV